MVKLKKICIYNFKHRSGKCNRKAIGKSKYCFFHLKQEGKKLNRKNFNDLDLHEAYLVNANLEFANLSFSNLAYANLKGTSLWHTNLQGALLGHADLTDADLFNAVIINTRDLRSAKIDYYDVNEKRGDHYCKKRSKTYEDYRSAIDAYGRAKAIHRDLKTYFRDAGLYNISGEHYIKEQIIEGKRLRIANRITKENDFLWHFPFHKYNNTKIFRISFYIETKIKYFLNRLHYFLSKYSEKPLRVIVSYLYITFLYAIIYWCIGGISKSNNIIQSIEPPSFFEYLYFSIVTFTTLGFGDYQPLGKLPQFLAASEAFIGAFLLAYFAVVISKKLMR